MDRECVAAIVPINIGRDPVERLASLFDLHYDRLYRLSRRLVSSTDDALDLVQETFLKAARRPNSVPRGFADEEAWLVRVLINTARDQWRKTSVRTRTDNPGSLSATETRSPEAALIARTAVWAALDSLPPRRRAITVMYEMDGVAVSAIASLLGISAITVRWHLSKARRALAQTLGVYTGEKQ